MRAVSLLHASRTLYPLAALFTLVVLVTKWMPAISPTRPRKLDHLPIVEAPPLPAPSSPLRFERLRGFIFCRILENSTLDTLAYVIPWNGSVTERQASLDEVVQLIDARASKIQESVMEKYGSVEPEDTYRFACYSAGEGSNPAAKLSRTPLLVSLDPLNYHSVVLPAIRGTLPPAQITSTRSSRRKYRLAYLVMIHGETGPTMANTKSLISELDDGSAVFLIHVDLRFPALFDRVQSWINDRNRIVAERQESDGNQSATIGGAATGNVFLAKFRYRGMWGHISLVWMQLSGFWELHDLAEWDYVINLSAHDFPLRRSREIHRLLSKEENRGRNFIRHWSEPVQTAVRLYRPHLPRSDRPSVEFSMTEITHTVGLRSPPFLEWTWCKHHQWMMLTREFVHFLRADEPTLHVLAFMEHTWIPDEAFFCAVAINRPRLSSTVISSNKRFAEFGDGMMHPHVLDIGWTHKFPENDEVGAEPAYYFVRKVQQFSGDWFDDEDEEGAGDRAAAAEPSSGQKLVEWIREKHLDRHIVPDGYGDIEGKAWVL